jgi:transposase
MPPPASNCDTGSPAPQPRINRALHITAIVQLRNPTQGRAYYDARKAAGKTSMEAIRPQATPGAA